MQVSTLLVMHDGNIADQHDDLDTDSLFGSPPPSPGRGRSPSPLALPGGQNSVQNVGTLALPGSHLCSELPPALPPAPSVNASSNVARQRSQPPTTAPSEHPLRSSTVPPSSGTATTRTLPLARKKKRPSRRSTPASEARPTPPPIALPSPTDPPPANFLRNQQALLGHAGLVSGVHPANLSLQRHMRGRSANNPIIVEDEDDRPSIGRKPLQTQHVTSGCLPVPSSEEILSNLVKQKNLIPVMDALVRLVAGSAVPLPSGSASNAQNAPPTASSSSTHVQPYHPYPYYPYPYAYPYYYSYPYGYTYPYAASAFQRSPAPSTSYAPPPPKKRRLNDVPAGASEWDVPYPFPEGQGPPDYHQNWQRQRGQQLVEDLVGLVKSAAKKAAVQKAQGEASAKDGPVIGSVEYYRERVLRNFRHPRYDILPTPHTATSSATPEREAIKSSPTSSSASAEDGSDIVVLDDPRAPAQSSPAKAATSPKPVFVAPMASLTDTTTATHSEESINKSQGDSMPMPPSPVTADLITNKVVNVASDNVDDCLPHHTQNNIDDLLSIFDDLPVGDLDALLNSTDFSSINPGNFDFSAFDMTGVMDVSESLAAREDRKSTRLNSSHSGESRMPSSA